MNISNITNTINQVHNLSIDYYLNKINNLNNYVKSTNLNQTFEINYDLIYKKSKIIDSHSNYPKIYGNYHLKSNSNIIYDPFDKILYYYNSTNNKKSKYFFQIKSFRQQFSNLIIEYYDQFGKSHQIYQTKLTKPTNPTNPTNQTNQTDPTNYFITENLDIIYKNEIRIENLQIDHKFYQSNTNNIYNIYHEICYDIPYILEPKNINYKLNLNINNSSQIYTSNLQNSNTKMEFNIEFN